MSVWHFRLSSIKHKLKFELVKSLTQHLYFCHVLCYSTQYIRDLWSFEIRFEFESDDSDSIRNWRAPLTCRRTTNHAHCSIKSFNRCAVVIEIYFIFMISCACTLASTVGVTVQYCLRNQENPHISVHLYYYFSFYTTSVAIGIEHVHDYTLIRFEFES